ncbi:MAG TPA: UvrD-helicase domain-containing protein [Polyangiaceae bacterium]|nr:UvrD-helicase domain-containing protein [Polyangiaceae bacterium]
MPELNDPQKQAVAHIDGPLLVFAGAGSGKTRVITYRIANLLANRVAPYRILAVTFTNKAAAEMRDRLTRLTSPEVTRDLWIGTFHSVCARLLRRYHDAVGLKRDFVIYDGSDQKAVVTRALRELGYDERQFAPKALLSAISGEKSEGRGPQESKLLGRQTDVVLEVFTRYEQALGLANAVDFDDLILKMTRLVEDPDSPAGRDLRGRFLHVLVDEFQDTNLIQYRLVRALSEHTRNLCVVGDDDQSIYRWRGADVRLIRSFKHDFGGAQVIKLEQNYRSTANIVKAALGVIEPSKEREPKELWTDAPAGDLVRVRAVMDEREEADHVLRGIQAELARGTKADSIAIFYRVHAQSRTLEEALRRGNVPYQIIGGMKFFERAEVKDLLSYLRLSVNPQSDADLARVINTPARGIGDKTVEHLLNVASESSTCAFDAIPQAQRELGTAANKKLGAFKTLLENLQIEAARLAPSELCGHILEVTGYRELLRKEDSAESDARLGNLEELVGSIQDYEEEAGERGETPSLSGYLESVALVAAIDSQKNGPMVSLMTVHSAKGLEFDAVFLTGMEQEMFPYRGIASGEDEELEEERRLAYVAITRARRRLTITYAGSRTLFGQTRYLDRSQFLDDLPEDAIKLEGSARAARSSSYGGSSYGGGSGVGSRYGAGYVGGYSPGGYRNKSGDSFEGQRYTGGNTAGGSRASAPLAPGSRVIERDEYSQDGAGEGQAVRPGSHVRHVRFGEGVVKSVEGGMKPSVVASFPGFGEKRILLEFLEPA